MVIAFWSTHHGQAATANLLSLAVTAANKAMKALITQTHFNLNHLDIPLTGKITERDFYVDTGIDSLMRCIKSAPLTEETINNCTISLLKNRLNILLGTKQNNRFVYEEEISRLVQKIIMEVKKYYDIVLIDTNSGMNAVTKNVLEAADIVVLNLRQNLSIIDHFYETGYPLDKNKLFYLFGAYDQNSRYTIKNIRRKFKDIKQSNSGEIPYNIEFSDSFSDGTLLKYMSRNMGGDETNTAYGFFQSVEETLYKLIKKAGLQ